jgi:diguanylate cyclase (GGDEF)-like protein
MSVSKLFHTFLFLLFLGLTFVVYLDQNSQLTVKGQQRLSSYQSYLTASETWPDNGVILYSLIQAHTELQFFQFIHSNENNSNLTEGKLNTQSSDPLADLFTLTLPDTRELGPGRLQVKLYTADLTGQALAKFKIISIFLWLAYLLITFVFITLMMKIKRKIGYAASYVNGLSSHQYHALEGSRLKAEFLPLAESLEICRSELKKKNEENTQENERLNREAFQDQVTGLATRSKFTQKLASISSTDKNQIGLMALIKATELGVINDTLGRAAGDDYLAKIANCMRQALTSFPEAECYRISTADFAVFIPGLIIKDGLPFVESLKAQLNEYQQTINNESIAHIGLVPYEHDIEPARLLSQADTAVSIAQTLGPNCFYLQDKDNNDELYGDTRWKEAIDDLIHRRALKFYQQAILPCQREIKIYNELFSRFYNTDGKFLPTATVIAMAERHGMVVDLDKLVIITTLKMLIENPALTGSYGINISAASIMQESFIAWLKDLLIKQRHIAARLVFEVNESGMQANLVASYKFVQTIHSVGARVSVEHFGMGFTSFKFFKQVRPDFIKLDGSYSSNIDTDTNNQFFIKMIINIARRLNIYVISTSVERQEEKLVLEKLLVDGLQGYYIAEPQALQNTGIHPKTYDV